MRSKVLVESGFYTEPVEYVVGTRVQPQHRSKFGSSTEKVVENKIYYVPLDRLLSVVFSSDRVTQMMKESCTCPRETGECTILDHISTGQLFRSHQLLQTYPDALL
jgi:hypothetical protein